MANFKQQPTNISVRIGPHVLMVKKLSRVEVPLPTSNAKLARQVNLQQQQTNKIVSVILQILLAPLGKRYRMEQQFRIQSVSLALTVGLHQQATDYTVAFLGPSIATPGKKLRRVEVPLGTNNVVAAIKENLRQRPTNKVVLVGQFAVLGRK